MNRIEFLSIVTCCANELFTYAMHLKGNEHDAFDLCQDTQVVMLKRNPDLFIGPEHVFNYMKQVMKNICIADYRKNSRKHLILSLESLTYGTLDAMVYHQSSQLRDSRRACHFSQELEKVVNLLPIGMKKFVRVVESASSVTSACNRLEIDKHAYRAKQFAVVSYIKNLAKDYPWIIFFQPESVTKQIAERRDDGHRCSTFLMNLNTNNGDQSSGLSDAIKYKILELCGDVNLVAEEDFAQTENKLLDLLNENSVKKSGD